MITPKIDNDIATMVAKVPSNTPGHFQGKIQATKTADNFPKTEELPKAKKDYTAQSNFQRFHQNSNVSAKSIRAKDNALTRIEESLKKAEQPLTEIVKLFPPFPPGSEERVKMLKSFNSYRKLINKLTFPPIEDNLNGDIVAQSRFSEEAGASGLFGQGGDRPALQPLPGDTKEQLNIQGLSETASDNEIRNVLEQLTDGKKSVLDRKIRLFEKAAEIEQVLHRNHPSQKSISQMEGQAELIGDSTEGAEGLSLSVKEALLMEPNRNINENHSQLIGLL